MFISVTLGQDISIIANVDHNIVELGETINFSISVSGSVRSISKPSLPDLSDFDVYSSGTSSNISIVPGAVSYQTDYSYVLVPRKVGTFVIGSAKVKYKGKEYSTQPIQIKVNPPSQSKQVVPSIQDREHQPSMPESENRDFFIEQVVDNRKPYVGEQVTMVFRFYQGQNLYEQPTLEWPDYNGFWVEDLPPQKSYNKYIDGRAYRVIEIRKALFPTVTGKLTIEPTILTIPPDAFSFFFDSDPFSLFSSRRKRSHTPKVLQTGKIVLDVKPLPDESKPLTFSGTVGEFNLTVSLDKDTVEVDQPVTLKAILSGTGNIKKLPGIDIPKLENFRLYDSGSNENISKSNYTVSGSKVFEWVLISTASGEYNLPEVSFSYFDLKYNKYKTLTKKPGRVYVKPSSIASVYPEAIAKNIIPAAKTSLNYIITEFSDNLPGEPLYKNKIVWLLQFLPLTWLAFLAIYTNRLKKLRTDIAYARRRLATKAARKALKKAREGLNNPEQFYSLIYNAVAGFISDKLNISTAGLTNLQIIELLKDTARCDDSLEEFLNFLNLCDAGRFSPAKPTHELMKEIYNKAEKLLSTLDRSLR